MERDARWPAVVVTVAAVAVAVFVTYLLTTWPPEPPGSTPRATIPSASPSPASEPGSTGPGQGDEGEAPDPTEVLVIGDSFTSGSDENSGPEWPQILGESLGWEMSVDAVPGSGYLAPGRTEPFGDRIGVLESREADLVLLAGGINDLGSPADEVASAAADVVATLSETLPDARIVVISPFSNGDPGPLTVKLATSLEEVAAENGVDYLDATRFLLSPELIGEDGLHPNQEGQQRLAQELRDALLELGIGKKTG